MLLILILATQQVFSEQLRLNEFKSGDTRIGLSLGYGENHKFPSATKDHFTFDSIRITYAKRSSAKIENLAELTYTELSEKEDNSALWLTFGHRRYFKVSPRTALGVQFTAGIMGMSHRVLEQSTRINFTEQLAFIYDYVVSERNTVSLEYRFLHASNGGVKTPNVGINASILSLGYNWYY